MQDLRDHYTDAQKTRIAKDARRSARAEASAIFAAGGAALAVAFFVFGFPGLLTLKLMTGLPETLIWVLMSFGLSTAIAAVHLPFATRTGERAKELHAAFLHAHEAASRKVLQERIAQMNAGPKDG